MKHLLLAAVAATALLSGTAHAAPLLSIEVFDGATLIGSLLNVTGGTANLVGLFDASFSSINISALGIGPGNTPLPSPDLTSTTIDAKSKGPATLTVLISQTGVTVPSPTKLLSTFTFNALTGTASSAVATNWISSTNTAFALNTLIASANLDPIVQAAGPFISGVTPTLFSETEKYVISFGGGNQSVSMTSQIVDAPEPAAAALFGIGLLGLGMVRRQKQAV